ncbi:hypothetical protein GGF31_001256 [Allomyces arbusculus]|nr:hypothetical protein GGF31_001256 [Allomyces arbusculus]
MAPRSKTSAAPSSPTAGRGNGKHAVVIGAGVGGAAIAARLAHQGFQVSVYEKNTFSGGRCSLIEQDGFRFDQGPSMYLMPKIFEETFADLDERLSDHLELKRCDPNYRVHFHDGDKMHLSSDLAEMRNELERLEPGSYDKFLAFLKESHAHYGFSIQSVLRRNFEKFTDMITWDNVSSLHKLHMQNSFYGRAAAYFRSDKLRKAFTFQSMYMGMSPFDAPGTYTLLPYTEFAEGIWYPKGGFHRVVDRLEYLAKQRGAEFHYGKAVVKINTTTGPVANAGSVPHATGVTLEDGTVVDADLLVVNADLVWTYNNLLPPSSYARRLTKKQQTSSSFTFYWGLKRKVPELDAHNLFLAEKYRDSFDSIFLKNTLPDECSFYIHVPSRMDPSAAPPGKEAIMVLVPTGCLPDDPTAMSAADWANMQARAKKDVLRVLQARTGVDFAPLIETEIINTPHTWQAKFNLHQGSILGLAHSVPQVLWFRPSTRHADFKNVFFVGASAHPGTGVPVVLYGARLVAQQIARAVQGGKAGLYASQAGSNMVMILALLAVIVAVVAAVCAQGGCATLSALLGA